MAAIKEYKDLVDVCSVAQIPQFAKARCVGKQFISKVNPFGYSSNVLQFAAGAGIPFYDGEKWRPIAITEDFTLNPASHLDDASGALEHGVDYYIYLCYDTGTWEVVVSKNATYPTGSTLYTSIKIGGFHCGTVRKVAADGSRAPINADGDKFGDDWNQNVVHKTILDNSVWDLINKPATFMPGMAKVGNLWMSIYQMSVEETITFMANTSNLPVTGGKLRSAYGKLPATGTEKLSQFNFNELAHKQGMRLPRYHEWLAGAFGSPQGAGFGNDNGWVHASARTYAGCRVNTSTGRFDESAGVKPYAVSAHNLCDCVGNVSEWGCDYFHRAEDSDSDASTHSWGWHDSLGDQQGQLHATHDASLGCLLFGGSWDNGVNAGPRCVGMSHCPWYVNTHAGARFVCDAAA